MRDPRLFLIADVGGPGLYHLGDEAMLEANIHTLRQLVPRIQFTVLSADPAWTSQRYGVQAVRWPGGLQDSTGLMVSGGGNLCDTWPAKVHERVALLDQAQELGIPTAMVGQTLGPALNSENRRLMAGPFRKLAWVGVRDDASAALALALGTPADRVHKQLDDAFLLAPEAVEDERLDGLRGESRPWIVVTLDASFGSLHRERSLGALASQLDALAEVLHAAIVFVPHVGGTEVGDDWADAVAGRALAAHLRTRPLLLGLWQAREVRWLIGQSALVVSTRYHPLVFATAAGVPSLGIYVDEYTRTKLKGALAAAGLERWCLSVGEAQRGEFLPLARDLWRQRDAVRDRLAVLRSEACSQERRRWNEICRALGYPGGA